MNVTQQLMESIKNEYIILNRDGYNYLYLCKKDDLLLFLMFIISISVVTIAYFQVRRFVKKYYPELW